VAYNQSVDSFVNWVMQASYKGKSLLSNAERNIAARTAPHKGFSAGMIISVISYLLY